MACSRLGAVPPLGVEQTSGLVLPLELEQTSGLVPLLPDICCCFIICSIRFLVSGLTIGVLVTIEKLSANGDQKEEFLLDTDKLLVALYIALGCLDS